ncbi:MAG: hypothetical protein ACJ8NR_08355, partial [Sulfurifustis sp.]
MNILLVPGNAAAGKSSCLSHRHLLLILLVGGVFLPVLFGVLTYKIQLLLEPQGAAEERMRHYA